MFLCIRRFFSPVRFFQPHVCGHISLDNSLGSALLGHDVASEGAPPTGAVPPPSTFQSSNPAVREPGFSFACAYTLYNAIRLPSSRQTQARVPALQTPAPVATVPVPTTRFYSSGVPPTNTAASTSQVIANGSSSSHSSHSSQACVPCKQKKRRRGRIPMSVGGWCCSDSTGVAIICNHLLNSNQWRLLNRIVGY